MNSLSREGSVDAGPLLKLAPLLVLVIIAIVVIGGIIVTVDAGFVGVVKRFGAVQDRALPAGLHFKIPLMDEVIQVDTRQMASEAKATAASRDLQTVTTDVTVLYSLKGDLAPQTIQNIGPLGKMAATVVEPAIQESVKAVTAKFTAEELVTQRELVKQQIQQAIGNFINTTLAEKGLENALTIANVAITDFKFSDEFNRAIEAKVQAEQQALQARNEKLKRVTQAEAASQEARIAAEAQAFAIEQQSKARADAIQREAEALRGNPELIRLRAIERWDGSLPRITGGGVVPFISVDDLAAEASRQGTP